MLFLKEVIEEYLVHCIAEGFTDKTLHNKEHELVHFRNYITGKRGIIHLESMTEFDMKAYFRHRQKTGLQPSSIDAIAKVVAAFMNWCVGEEYIDGNKMEKVELPRIPERVTQGFTPDEVIKMINVYSTNNYLQARNKAIVAMLADLGLRAGEIRGIKVGDLNENSLLVNGKGKKQRMVFISPSLMKILIKYERLKNEFFHDRIVNSDCYFLTYQGNQLTHISLHKVIKDAAKKAKVEDAHPHKFRHFYSVQAINAGMDVHTLSRLLGHSTIMVTQEYLRTMTNAEIEMKALTYSPLSNIKKRK